MMTNNYKCHLCNNSDIVLYKALQNYFVLECKSCGVQFLHPQPSEETLNNIYNEDYFLGSQDQKSIARFILLKKATAKYYLEQARSFSGINQGELLEIGCGSGDFLVEAQSSGFEVTGIEYSNHSVMTANNKLGSVRVQQGQVQENSFLQNTFQIIVAFDLIEHVNDPILFLNHLYKFLRPGGWLYLATPSLDSWSAKLMRKHWMEYKVEHLWYFSKKSLIGTLNLTGFSNIKVLPNYKILNIDYINMHFQKYRIPIISPLVYFFQKLLPSKLTSTPFRISASGMMVFAQK